MFVKKKCINYLHQCELHIYLHIYVQTQIHILVHNIIENNILFTGLLLLFFFMKGS